MIAFPSATGVTTPSVDTFATLSLLELQVTFLFVALSGATVALSVPVAPFAVSVIAVLSSFTPVTATVAAILILNSFCAVCLLPSVTTIVNLNSPDTVGVPVIEHVPVVASLLKIKPLGRVLPSANE